MKKKWRYAGILFCMLIMFCSFAGVGTLYAAETASTETVATEQQVTEKIPVKKKGWVTYKGKKYYYKSSKLVTGWQTIGGKKYYFEKSGDVKGQMVTGWKEIGEKKYYFTPSGKKKGQMVTGWKTIKGKKYYFEKSGKKKGQMVTGWKKIGSTYYYFKSNGVRDNSKTTNSSRASDKTGTAKQKTYRRAQAIVASITTDDMTKEETLKVCFNYVMKYKGRRPRTPHYYDMDWPVVYANDMFLDGSGNCFSYAAAFAFMAKACGYKNVYCCNDTGHGWCEIDGLIYDPEEYRNTKYKYYGTSYSKVPVYKRGIADWKSSGQGFKHVKI